MAERSRRGQPGGASSSKGDRARALADLVALRRGDAGAKRADQFEIKIKEDVYDVVDEKRYKEIVSNRRAEAGGFIVGDDGEYVDIGEEDEWEGVPEERKRQRRENSKATAPRPKQRPEPPPGYAGRSVSSMFAPSAKRKGAAYAPANDLADAVDLDDILASVKADDKDRERVRRQRGTTNAPAKVHVQVHVQAPAVQEQPYTPQRSTRIYPAAHQTPVEQKPFANRTADDLLGPGRHDKAQLDLKPNICESIPDPPAPLSPSGCEPMDTEPAIPELPVHADCSVPDASSSHLPGQAGGSVPHASDSPATIEPQQKAPVSNIKQEPLETNESGLGRIAATTGKAAGKFIRIVGGFKALYVDDGSEPEAVLEPSAALAGDVNLPLAENGSLPFFFLDGYEQQYDNDGTVHLFGKVRLQEQYVSCAVEVTGLQRCVYAIPTSQEMFEDPELEQLEAAAAAEAVALKEQASGSSEPVQRPARRALLVKLQSLCSDLKMEVKNILEKMKVGSIRLKPVKRLYCFEKKGIPRGEQYVLKINYSYKANALPMDLKGEHFCALFGTQTSALELLLVKRKIMGSSWLSVSKASKVAPEYQHTWCKLEVVVADKKQITPSDNNMPVPPLIVGSMSIKTVINHRTNVNEVAAVSIVFCRNVKVDGPTPKAEWNTPQQLKHFSLVRRLDGGTFPVGFAQELKRINSGRQGIVLHQCNSERELYSLLLAKLQGLDLDVLVGHNNSAWDLDILLHRMQACKVNHWSRIGRLRRSSMPKLHGGGNTFGGGASPGVMQALAGRLICDTYLSARELVREVSYSMTQLASSLLHEERTELAPADVPAKYLNAKSLVELVEHAEGDAWLALGLMFHLSILPLTRQLTTICGNQWSKTLQCARAQRIEYLLLHEFHGHKHILPDKLSNKERFKNKNSSADSPEDDFEEPDANNGARKKKGPAYTGGLVLEPKVGLYDKYVVLLDFNSLYPSIIQEYNICFTTVEPSEDGALSALPTTGKDAQGILPQVLRRLVQRRAQVKDMLKNERNPIKRQQLDIRQQALKLTANSMYGCLGFTNSRFYAKPLAELITSQGREILQSTVDLVRNNLNMEVIYGDTDSIMIHTNTDNLAAVTHIATAVKKEVNKLYRLLEIEMDGVFKSMLLLKKKKYAAMKVEFVQGGEPRLVMEQKGLDIVRRDWSVLSKDAGSIALKEILSGRSKDEVVETIHTHLRELRERMDKDEIPLEKYVITKTLTKPPEDYPDAKNQPHVQVALRLRNSGRQEGTSVGETVPYVICKGRKGSNSSSIAERAHHIDEIAADSNLAVDKEYYLAQQVHPVVSRLCAVIDGTDAAHLAECLGLEASKFRRTTVDSHQEEAMLAPAASLDDDDRYLNCEPLELVCPQCSQRFQFKGVAAHIPTSSDVASTLDAAEDVLACPTCPPDQAGKRPVVTSSMLANQVKQRAEEFIARYYDGWLKCNDDICGQLTRNPSLRVVGGTALGTLCIKYPNCNGQVARQYSEADLYKQLCHFHRLLDTDRLLEQAPSQDAKAKLEQTCKAARQVLQPAAAVLAHLRNRSAYKWISLQKLCITVG
eukprot:jgi/Chlat1/2847/Chrsp194S03002